MMKGSGKGGAFCGSAEITGPMISMTKGIAATAEKTAAPKSNQKSRQGNRCELCEDTYYL